MSGEYKSIAYTLKDMQRLQRQFLTKLLRALRNHEKRISRLEKNSGIIPSPYEISEDDLKDE